MGYNENFSGWLQREMDLRHWNQNDLAREAGIARQTVNGILNSKRAPGIQTCNGIAKAMKLPYSVLYERAGLIPRRQTNEMVEEIKNKIDLLSPESQKVLLDLINGMLEREKNENLYVLRKGKSRSE
jgi:transcriptional regulator with XRE-family HTH domain